MPPLDPPKYWRSVEDREGQLPSSEGREFPAGVPGDDTDGATRRDFLKIVGGTAALAGLAGCQNPPDHVLPYAKQPPEIIPGNPLHYASSFTRDGYGMGVIVAAREGRPIKVEGNPDHPASLGASSVYDQAAIWHLYDPQRARTLRSGKHPKAWARFVGDMAQKAAEWKKDGGAGLRFLVEPSGSPLEADLRKQLLAAFPNAKFYAFSATGNDNAYAGTQLAFGRPLETRFDFQPARAILSLDADFLSQGAFHVRYSRHFADHRVPQNELNRLYVVEPGHSATGTAADHRLRVKAGEVVDVAVALANELAPGKVPPDRSGGAGRFANNAWIKAAAKDLKARGAAALVVAGARQPAVVHAIAAVINASLGSKCVSYTAPVLSDVQFGPAQLKALADEVKAGKVDTLVCTAYNPVYTAPADIDVAAMLRGCNSIYRAMFDDETARHANWFIPATHELEEWGDARAVDGTVSLKQPLIHPLFGGISLPEVWAALLGSAARGAQRILRDSWKARANKPDFDKWWERTLQKGIVEDTALPAETVSPSGDLASALSQLPKSEGGLEVAFYNDNKVADGRYGDVAWLQELPEAVTKMTWGNNVALSPATAKKLGVTTADMVQVTVAGKSLTAPAYVLPGMADDTLQVAIGYGRQGAEMIAREIGADVQPLRSAANTWWSTGAQLSLTGLTQKLPIDHDHWSMEGRPIALDVDAVELEEGNKQKKLKLPLLEENRGEQPSMYAPYEYTGFKWGMAIDMSRCSGCNACVLACESENNVLIVGPDQLRKGRDMHWLRIDRYFTGELEDPETVMQPLMCVHCENAPCEYVCPVNATVHSDEGLNEMVYNRCVGTRYCSNNCPYKVRRFNYLNWHNNLQGTEEMAMNPDVTVRSRGVMEKCTYCVQRIERYRIDQRINGKGIGDYKDTDFTTACAQSCPSGAIVFGSLHDPKTQVSKLHTDERAYQLLHELGTRPRTVHLARVRNKNPEISEPAHG
jgi:molybdopterin-containing oxidoreductase family iron-sulfur binding subunit